MKRSPKIPRPVLASLEAHLISEKHKVKKQIIELKLQDPFSDTDRLMDNAASDTDAKEEFNHERYQAMLFELDHQLEDIEAAQLRIEKGTYGYCLKCGRLIDTDRLAAIPTAKYCIDHISPKK